ncbi:NACHT domain-containing protein [Pasteurella multocida]|uniref:NACHT domain-containing protein n=1 Tax=Pasteurella multocida TaxID=747 RepID=UPI002877308D|nr:AAA family ATPase [Pasteurella multocida]WND44119.1 NACHT domain-containing protein [Pasteurella multocida]
MSGFISINQDNEVGDNSLNINISSVTTGERVDFELMIKNLENKERIESYIEYLNVFRNFMYNGKSIDLREVYIPLSLEVENRPTYKKLENSISIEEGSKNAFLINEKISFDELLLGQKAKRIVNVIGAAGQGKSSILRYISSNELSNDIYFPIYIPCLKISEINIFSNIMEILERFFDFPQDGEKYLPAFIKHLDVRHRKKILIILDGFDELPYEIAPEFLNHVESISDKHLLPILISSRDGSISNNSTRAIHYRVCDLSVENVRQMIERYTPKGEYINSIFEKMEEDDDFANCIKTPLLACLVADNYIHFQSTYKKPKMFYNEILDVLLRKHDSTKERGVIRNFQKKYTNIDYDMFSEAFYILCLFSLINKKSNFTMEELIQYSEKAISHSKCNIIEINQENKKSLPRDFAESIINDTCLIIEKVEGKDNNNYIFCHKSIWEFYAAKFFQKLQPSEDLHNKIIEVLLKKYIELDVFFLNHYEFICLLDDFFALKYLLIPYLESIGISDEGKDKNFLNAKEYLTKKMLENSQANLRKRRMLDEEIDEFMSKQKFLGYKNKKNIKRNSSVSECQFIINKINPIIFISKFMNNKIIDTNGVDIEILVRNSNSLFEDVIQNGINSIDCYLDTKMKKKKEYEISINLEQFFKDTNLLISFENKIVIICENMYNVYSKLKEALVKLENANKNTDFSFLE